MKKIVKIFSPKHQQLTYLLYCSGVFKYSEIYFSDNFDADNIFLKLNIIDVEFLKSFVEVKNFNKNFRYIIFFPNGEKQYRENIKKIEYLKKILGKKIQLFFVGDASKVNNNTNSLSFKKFDKVKFYNASIRTTICFKYPLFFSLIGILKNIAFFFTQNQKKKSALLD